MSELLNKLSSYNIFNYLLPGIIFSVLASNITKYSFIQSDIVIGVFVYYFIGLVVSRLGSLVLEPFLKWSTFVKFSEYKKFVHASKKDEKIEILSEANNSYRTLSSLFILLLMLKGYESVELAYPFISEWNSLLIIILLFIMFLFSYRKQTKYIHIRVGLSSGEE